MILVRIMPIYLQLVVLRNDNIQEFEKNGLKFYCR